MSTSVIAEKNGTKGTDRKSASVRQGDVAIPLLLIGLGE
jgi:hypothetical protein